MPERIWFIVLMFTYRTFSQTWGFFFILKATEEKSSSRDPIRNLQIVTADTDPRGPKRNCQTDPEYW
jgi:hypothetical protein